MLMYISPLAELVSLDVNLTRFLQSDETMINHLGLLGASLTMLMYISPLAELVSLKKKMQAIYSALCLPDL